MIIDDSYTLIKLTNTCPKLSFTTYSHTGAPVVQSLRGKFPGVLFEVHMMVSNPEQWIEDMSKAGADIYTFHLEASDNPQQTIDKIRSAGMHVRTFKFNKLF